MVTVKIIEKTYWYDYKTDTVTLNAIHVEYVQTSPREAMDLVMEVNSKMTEGEQLLELKSGNCRMVVCYATL